MIIQDLNFFEQIDNLDDIQGGSAISATSEKPGANASARSEGGTVKIGTAAESNGVGVSTVLGSDSEEGIGTLELAGLLQGFGIEEVMDLTLM